MQLRRTRATVGAGLVLAVLGVVVIEEASTSNPSPVDALKLTMISDSAEDYLKRFQLADPHSLLGIRIEGPSYAALPQYFQHEQKGREAVNDVERIRKLRGNKITYEDRTRMQDIQKSPKELALRIAADILLELYRDPHELLASGDVSAIEGEVMEKLDNKILNDVLLNLLLGHEYKYIKHELKKYATQQDELEELDLEAEEESLGPKLSAFFKYFAFLMQ